MQQDRRLKHPRKAVKGKQLSIGPKWQSNQNISLKVSRKMHQKLSQQNSHRHMHTHKPASVTTNGMKRNAPEKILQDAHIVSTKHTSTDYLIILSTLPDITCVKLTIKTQTHTYIKAHAIILN
jgi:hypothetical protein